MACRLNYAGSGCVVSGFVSLFHSVSCEEVRAGAGDVNGRDAHGRTVLHLLASSSDAEAELASEAVTRPFIRTLLSHPQLDLNVQDTESGEYYAETCCAGGE